MDCQDRNCPPCGPASGRCNDSAPLVKRNGRGSARPLWKHAGAGDRDSIRRHRGSIYPALVQRPLARWDLPATARCVRPQGILHRRACLGLARFTMAVE